MTALSKFLPTYLKMPEDCVDCHQHVFPIDVTWLARDQQPPRSRLTDLAKINQAHGVRGILIQVENRYAPERGYLLGGCIQLSNAFAGAILGIDMIQHTDSLNEAVQQLNAESSFRGIRFLLECDHAVLIPGSDGGIREKFVESLAVVSELGILFEFCGWGWQRKDILEVLQTPGLENLRAVLDHCLKFEPNPQYPDELPFGFEADMKRAAACKNAYVKWSELLKYVARKGNGSEKWTLEEAAKPMGTMLRSLISLFGIERIIWGSGWPVASWAPHVQGSGENGAITYLDVINASLLAMEHIGLSQADVDNVMRDNAIDCYALR